MKKILIFLLVVASPFAGRAQESGPSILKMGGGARSLALQEAVTAAAGGVDSIHYNPGGLAALSRTELGLTHAELVLDSALDIVDFGHSTAHGAWGVGVHRFSSGNIEARDSNQNVTGDFSTEEMVGSLSYAKSLTSRFGVGMSVKYIHSRIASDNDATGAADMGAVMRLSSRPVWVGASILNVGRGLRYQDKTTPLPLTYAVGAAAQIAGTLKVTLDVKHEQPLHRINVVSGFELSLSDAVDVRAGYASAFRDGSEPLEAVSAFRGGLGLSLAAFRLDYALSPFADIGVTHRFTLSTSF